MESWHFKREEVARDLGYNVDTFCMSELHPYTIFPHLERKWKKRDATLMRLYEVLGQKISESDIFIHYNGALIHPEFLEQFNQLKIYNCADDPDASDVLSKPVVHAYDIHAISNPACINLYHSWGCKKVFFWPIGSFYYDELSYNVNQSQPDLVRNVKISFVGSKKGVSKYRYVARIPLINKLNLIWNKKSFFDRLEKAFPCIEAYGSSWANGRIEDYKIPALYSQSLIGINVHNSLGPINGRLYDLAAYGVCQICDNKSTLHYVFDEGKEILGFESEKECHDLISYYLANPNEARKIGMAGNQRFLRNYTMKAIWEHFFDNLANSLDTKNNL